VEAARAAGAGSGWQPVIDELRPFTVDLWQNMSLLDRRRFLRHLRPWWDVHRHRMASSVADRVDAARASGQVQVLAGRVREYRVSGRTVEVVYRPRGQAANVSLRVARVVNCSGPGADFQHIGEPLFRGLLAAGIARPDPPGLGLDVTANCALRAACSRSGP
jgi:uncharacterized NAD(P)/FAD-binding protein YdhS